MKNLLAIILVCFSFLANAQVRMPDSVSVFIKSQNIITSKTARYGQEFEFVVTRDVVVDDVVIIEAGARAFGVVTQAIKADFVGDEGQLEIQMDIVEGISQDYPISGPNLFSQGKSRKTTSCLLAFVVTPFFLLLKGQEAKIYPTTEIEVVLGTQNRRTRAN